jgi:hypothetical protein
VLAVQSILDRLAHFPSHLPHSYYSHSFTVSYRLHIHLPSTTYSFTMKFTLASVVALAYAVSSVAAGSSAPAPKSSAKAPAPAPPPAPVYSSKFVYTTILLPCPKCTHSSPTPVVSLIAIPETILSTSPCPSSTPTAAAPAPGYVAPAPAYVAPVPAGSSVPSSLPVFHSGASSNSVVVVSALMSVALGLLVLA